MRWNSLPLVVFALLGLIASIMLVLTEIWYYQDPGAALNCNVNALISCSKSLGAWQAHLFLGISNSIVGTAIFGGLTAWSLLQLAGATFPAWTWKVLIGGLLAAGALVAFFVTVSLTTFRALCPYCLVVWLATLGLLFTVPAAAIEAEALPAVTGPARLYKNNYWLLLALTLLVITAVMAIGLRDVWQGLM